MANSDGENEEESPTYEMLVKQIILQQWSKDDDETLKGYLTIIGKAEKLSDAKKINFRQEVICDAVVAAFDGNRDKISKAESTKTTARTLATDLAKRHCSSFRKSSRND